MTRIIKFPPAVPQQKGFSKIRKSRKPDPESYGQLSLFDDANVIDMKPDFNYFDEAIRLDELGDDRAESYYQKAINHNQMVADAYCNLGIICAQRQEHLQSIDFFTRCLAVDGRHYEAHFNLANVYAEQGNYDLSQIHYLLCIQMNESFSDAHYNLSLILLTKKQYHESLKHLNHYIEMENTRIDPVIKELQKTLKALVS